MLSTPKNSNHERIFVVIFAKRLFPFILAQKQKLISAGYRDCHFSLSFFQVPGASWDERCDPCDRFLEIVLFQP